MTGKDRRSRFANETGSHRLPRMGDTSMKGLVTKALAGAALAGGLSAGGCEHYQKCVDPCWPDRYNNSAQRETISAFAPQVQNGHILDQTIFNYQFESGTDRLTEAGKDQLDILIRRRPVPDPRIFLAEARDVGYEPGNPDALDAARKDLDNRRSVAIQKYLGAQTAGRPMQFEVVVHDPMPVGEHADPANRAIRLNHNSSTGTLAGGASATTASSTGASGGGGGTAGATSGGGGGTTTAAGGGSGTPNK
jgi:hypothetical protein